MANDVREVMENGFRRINGEFFVLRTEIATQGAAVRDQMAAQGTALRDEMAAQGTALRDQMAAQGTTLRDEMAAQGTTLRDEMAAQGTTLRDEMKSEFATVRAEIKQSADDNRRYFQMLTEQMQDSVKLVAEATANNAYRLENHEKRLHTLEQPGRG